eukprot:TRINITY_DN9265_c0_g1_i2.p1 TRINITY_DN9265_c0_g1~~TRINITY_DN9265_c0_g1_i2.p1  ORF type:complete len:902 (-),score=261.87 TRINITY_DN9265_c0_g1_i2:176-2881(-)
MHILISGPSAGVDEAQRLAADLLTHVDKLLRKKLSQNDQLFPQPQQPAPIFPHHNGPIVDEVANLQYQYQLQQQLQAAQLQQLPPQDVLQLLQDQIQQQLNQAQQEQFERERQLEEQIRQQQAEQLHLHHQELLRQAQEEQLRQQAEQLRQAHEEQARRQQEEAQQLLLQQYQQLILQGYTDLVDSVMQQQLQQQLAQPQFAQMQPQQNFQPQFQDYQPPIQARQPFPNHLIQPEPVTPPVGRRSGPAAATQPPQKILSPFVKRKEYKKKKADTKKKKGSAVDNAKKEGPVVRLDPSKPLLIVVDTNCFILHLADIMQLKRYEFITVIIPFVVIQELDKLKTQKETKFTARNALRQILSALKENETKERKWIRGQTIFEVLPDKELGVKPRNADDQILNCMHYFNSQLSSEAPGTSVILLTGDVGLSVKAMMHKYLVFTVPQFLPTLPSVSAAAKACASKKEVVIETGETKSSSKQAPGKNLSTVNVQDGGRDDSKVSDISQLSEETQRLLALPIVDNDASQLKVEAAELEELLKSNQSMSKQEKHMLVEELKFVHQRLRDLDAASKKNISPKLTPKKNLPVKSSSASSASKSEAVAKADAKTESPTGIEPDMPELEADAENAAPKTENDAVSESDSERIKNEIDLTSGEAPESEVSGVVEDEGDLEAEKKSLEEQFQRGNMSWKERQKLINRMKAIHQQLRSKGLAGAASPNIPPASYSFHSPTPQRADRPPIHQKKVFNTLDHLLSATHNIQQYTPKRVQFTLEQVLGLKIGSLNFMKDKIQNHLENFQSTPRQKQNGSQRSTPNGTPKASPKSTPLKAAKKSPQQKRIMVGEETQNLLQNWGRKRKYEGSTDDMEQENRPKHLKFTFGPPDDKQNAGSADKKSKPGTPKSHKKKAGQE